MSEDSSERPLGTSRLRRLRLFVVTGLVAGLLTLAFGEILVRIFNPTPRVQVIRMSNSTHIEEVDRIPVWRGAGSDTQENLSCLEAKHGRQIAVVGSSILFGSGLEDDLVFFSHLQAAVNQRHPEAPVCILNFAQPGYTFGAKWIRARQAITRFKPDLILFELWHNDVNSFARLNDTALNVGALATNEWNHPDLFGLPLSWNAWLLENVRLFQYASLALATKGEGASARVEQQWERYVQEELSKAIALEERIRGPRGVRARA